jgi:hypothetical protein
MTPMTGGITDTDNDGLVFLFGLIKRGLTPRIPIDGIVSVHQQVRTALTGEMISVFMFMRLFMRLFVFFHFYLRPSGEAERACDRYYQHDKINKNCSFVHYQNSLLMPPAARGLFSRKLPPAPPQKLLSNF